MATNRIKPTNSSAKLAAIPKTKTNNKQTNKQKTCGFYLINFLPENFHSESETTYFSDRPLFNLK